MSAGPSIEALAFAEIEDLHKFFVQWFTATDTGSIDFAVCERAFAADFVLVNPDGSRHGRKAVVERLAQARGRVPIPFEISILDPCTVWLRNDAILVAYIERQLRDGRTTQRRSVALLTLDDTAPRGMLWRFLQETWMMPGDGG